MNHLGTGRFAVWASAVALVFGLLTVVLAAPYGATAWRWSLLGWAAMATIGVAGGVWMSRTHGTLGSGFMIALGTCMLARLIAAALGTLFALTRVPGAFWPFVLGLAAGYVPLQVFESIWFTKRARSEQSAGETAGSALTQRSSRA